jgi:glutamine cyclotransferase
LPIDWKPVAKYFSEDRNASFEGITIGNGKLYVANERKTGRIIVVDLASMKVIDHFTVRPKNSQARDIHYSDLCWHKGYLYALLRESSLVLKVNPEDKRVLAQYSFYDMEREKDVAYTNPFPTSLMEGLAVDDQYIWLVTDNNGLPRIRHPLDIRPTLFQCARPD